MIRLFSKSDMDQVIKIWLEASILAHDFVERDFWTSKISVMCNVYIPASETYVYEMNYVVGGFLSLNENNLSAIFVSPHLQGKGIGKELIAKAMKIRNKLSLTVYKENTKSILFYERNGFKKIKEQIDEHTGHPEIVMEWIS